MTWYGKPSAKQLEQLLETKPKLLQLFAVPDFIQQLKSYNSKLLEYITNTPSLIHEAIQLIITPPSLNDSNDRKYKHPLQAVEMVEAQTTCVLNSFFKEASSGTCYFDLLFDILQEHQILPLLAGYFFRTNICLLNNRYKETLERVYLKPKLLYELINHASLMPICNTIQLYLNLDVNKCSESESGRLQIKKQLLRRILQRIQSERKAKGPDSGVIIENLMTVVIETIEKYYLILDGKTLVEILTSQQCIETMLALIKENWEGAYPAFNFFISLINYYSFSSFNADETDPDKIQKNLQRLEAQPMVIALRYYMPLALDKINKSPTITLYEYKLLEVMCHCISISSQEILKTIKDIRFFASLIQLLFKHQNNNILHMLIEKSFLHVFISERKIYEHYKKHLFCEIDIIELTASRVLGQYEEGKLFESLKKKTCFGHFMRILKIYSGIQTTDQSIINAIKAKTEVWNRISTNLIKPYEAISFKQLGSYEGIPEGKEQQFEVKKSNQPEVGTQGLNPRPLTNSMIEEIRKEDELLPPLKKQLDLPKSVLPQPIKEEIIQEKKKQEQLLKAPTHNLTVEFTPDPPREIKKVESFKQFMTKKKVEAEQEIRMKRSLSHEKRLSGSRGKMSGPSPKKNSWTEKNSTPTQNDKTDTSLSSKMSSSAVVHNNPNKTSDMPRIPHYSQNANTSLNLNRDATQSTQLSQQNSTTGSGYRSYYGSSIQQPKTQPSSSRQQTNKSSLQNSQKSEKNMELLKKIKVIRIEAPKQKKYRRLEEKDKVLLDFLGITSGGK